MQEYSSEKEGGGLLALELIFNSSAPTGHLTN
jgi:hypothetical protein